MRSEDDLVSEGRRLLGLASESGVPLRLLGGAAIRLRTPNLPAALAREYRDLDFVALPGSTAEISRLFGEAGYAPDTVFNTLHGKRRLVFVDREHGRKSDVFVGSFEMSHTIPVAERLELEPLTLPLAELLVTKLQIFELNEKDIKDAIGLIVRHEVAEADGDEVNARRIAELCGSDWGLWRTLTANLATVRDRAGDYALSADDLVAVTRRVESLLARIEAEPKSRAWRLRARVGDRVRWYELPEEV
jgi:hypothetical protein